MLVCRLCHSTLFRWQVWLKSKYFFVISLWYPHIIAYFYFANSFSLLPCWMRSVIRGMYNFKGWTPSKDTARSFKHTSNITTKVKEVTSLHTGFMNDPYCLPRVSGRVPRRWNVLIDDWVLPEMKEMLPLYAVLFASDWSVNIWIASVHISVVFFCQGWRTIGLV